MGDDDYTERFKGCQAKMIAMIAKCPAGCQNWSYQKSVNFKKLLKKVEAAIKLLPKSKHVEFLKIEQLAQQLEGYYK
jgi:hypothetical protein